MPFDNINKAIVAFKHLLGKSNTDVDKEIGNEAESIFLNTHASTIFTDDIHPSPTAAESSSPAIVVKVIADFVLDATSNGHSYFAVWPNPLPANAPLGTNPGDRVRDAVPPTYGIGYEAKPYDTASNPISVGDPRDWIYQYNSGIFFQQDENVGLAPLTIDLYVYIGTFLSDHINNLISARASVLSASDQNLTTIYETSGNFSATGLLLTDIPIKNSQLIIVVNGVISTLGNGVKTRDCFFSRDAGVHAIPFNDIEAGDELYWNGDVTGFELDFFDNICMHYLTGGSISEGGSAYEGIPIKATELLFAGDYVNIFYSEGVPKLRQADALLKREAHGYIQEDTAIGEFVTVYAEGINNYANHANSPGFVAGEPLFLIDNGRVTNMSPVSSSNLVQLVGHVVDQNNVICEIGQPSYLESFTNQLSVVIDHALNKKVHVTVLRNDGIEIGCSVTQDNADINKVTIDFDKSVSGIILCT